MLTCNPRSIFSWNFVVTGAPRGAAELRFDFFTETGSISYGGDHCEVRKSGFLSGEWTLLLRDKKLAIAQKPSAFFRQFTITHGENRLELAALSPFTRAYHLSAHGQVLGQIDPEHMMTRRASIRCDSSVPIAVQLFAFWLVVLTWRRAANDGGS